MGVLDVMEWLAKVSAWALILFWLSLCASQPQRPVPEPGDPYPPGSVPVEVP